MSLRLALRASGECISCIPSSVYRHGVPGRAIKTLPVDLDLKVAIGMITLMSLRRCCSAKRWRYSSSAGTPNLAADLRQCGLEGWVWGKGRVQRAGESKRALAVMTDAKTMGRIFTALEDAVLAGRRASALQFRRFTRSCHR